VLFYLGPLIGNIRVLVLSIAFLKNGFLFNNVFVYNTLFPFNVN